MGEETPQSNLQEVDVKFAAQAFPDLYEDVRRNEGRAMVFCHNAANIRKFAGDLKLLSTNCRLSIRILHEIWPAEISSPARK